MTNLQTMFENAVRLHQSGFPQEAIEIYFRILPTDKNNPYLLFLVGTAFGQIGKHEEGVTHLQKSAKITPNPITYNNLAGSLVALSRHSEAIHFLKNAIELDPNYSEGYCNLGIAQRNAGLLKDSLRSLEESIRLAPNNRQAITEKGITLSSLGDYSRSLECHINASKLDPAFPDSYHLIGEVLIRLDRISESVPYFGRAIELKPYFPDAYSSRGGAQKKLGDFDEALADYNKAIELKPDYAEAYSNRGNTLKELHRFDEALADYNTAIELKPDYAEAYSNRGNTLKELHRFDEALADYNTAIELKPDYAEAYWNKSLLLILSGQYEEGWELYEWRFETKEQKQNHYIFPQHKWRGDGDPNFKKLLIYTEQGLGDFIQFCRYLPLVKQLGTDLIVEVPTALIPLASTLKCDMTVIAKGDHLPEFDAYCPIMSLPYAFKTIVETIPAQVPYLFADETKVNQWRAKLGQSNLLRIGLAWSGSTIHKNDKNRSVQLEVLEKLLDMPIEWHSLQKEYRDYDLEQLAKHAEIHQHQDDLHDFSDTAALIECMDLVISVDTSVAHVAGAIGKPVLILLPYAPDYRWMLDRDDTPWYPTAKLFRQPSLDDWQSVIQSVRESLTEFIEHNQVNK